MKATFLKYENFWIFLGIIFFHLILKLSYIDFNPIAFDEPFSIYHSQGSPKHIITELFQGNNPPLYELMLHYWIQLKDTSAYWVRFPSVIFSSITAGILFLLGKKMANTRTAVLAVALFTLSTYQYTYAHEARSYALFGLLSIVSMYFFLGWKKNLRTSSIVITVVCNALLLYTHYLSIFIPVAQGLIVLRKKKEVLQFMMYSLVTVALSIPIFNVFVDRLSITVESGGTWVSPAALKEIIYGPIYFVNTKFALIPLALFFISFVGFHFKQKWSPTFTQLLIWFSVPYLLMFLISLESSPFHFPVFIDRYYFFTALPFYLLVAFCLDVLLKKSLLFFAPLSVLFFILMGSFFTINPTHDRKPNEVAGFVKQKLNQGKSVAIAPSYYNLNFTYHFDRSIFSTLPEQDMNKKLRARNIYFIQNQEELLRRVKSNQSIIYLQGKSTGILENQDNISIKALKLIDEYIQPYRLSREKM